MRLKIGLIVIAISLLLGQGVQAVGVGVKPKAINLSVPVGRETTTEFLVINVAAEPAIYQVYPDALVDEVKISPTDFQLDPGASKIIKATVKIKSPGLFGTNISVVARPLGAGGLAAASGVKLPLSITASGLPLWLKIIGLVLTICLVLIFGLLLIKRHQNKVKINKLNFL